MGRHIQQNTPDIVGNLSISTGSLSLGDGSFIGASFVHSGTYNHTNYIGNNHTLDEAIAVLDDALATVSGMVNSLNHNNILGLQGGTTDQYYHLTAAQHTVAGNTSGTNTGDQDLSGYAQLAGAFFSGDINCATSTNANTSVISSGLVHGVDHVTSSGSMISLRDVEVLSSGYGFIITNADDNKWRLTVDPGGNVITTAL